MQRRKSRDQEQKFEKEETGKHKFVSMISTSHQKSLTRKSSTWSRSAKSILNTHYEIKQRSALSSVSPDNFDDLLKIRSIRQQSTPAYNDDEESTIITINVSGDRFQTYLSTLQSYPDTLLGDKNKRKYYWNPKTQEYFFDRHRACFEEILYYYQSNGRLRRPDFVPLDTFMEEVAFFQLGFEASAQFRQAENIKEVKDRPIPQILWRRIIWFYFEYPQHSHVSRIINLISMLFTIFSCVSLAVESLPDYTNRWNNICKEQANVSLNSTYVPRCPALFTSPFFIIQTICVAYFTIEFLLRLISTPSYFQFMVSFFNWVDLSAIIPYYVFLTIQLANTKIGLDTNAILCIRLLRILRFSRIFKIYLVFQRLKSLRVLTATIKESLVDFVVMVSIITLGAFLFGAATYFAEQETNGDVFDSIPKATYWGIITMTGVGYGDMCPITAAGRIITCLCALTGAATMGMLVSVLVGRYQRVYNQKMYVPEQEMPPVDFRGISDDDDIKSVMSSQKLSRRRELSAEISQGLSLLQEKIKGNQHPSRKLQFVVSFNDGNKDNSATDHILSLMKRKLTEVISTTDSNISLQLVDNESKELWSISSSNSSPTYTSNYTPSTNTNDHQLHKF